MGKEEVLARAKATAAPEGGFTAGHTREAACTAGEALLAGGLELVIVLLGERKDPGCHCCTEAESTKATAGTGQARRIPLTVHSREQAFQQLHRIEK